MWSAYLASPVASSRRQLQWKLAIAAHVSLYARSGGSSNRSPKPSSEWRDPLPPVR